jgi:hypothetical protein
MMRAAERLRPYDPATYLIRVSGVIGLEWSEQLGGMRIRTLGSLHQAVTEIAGPVQDQAALIAVLELLYDLGMPILSVELMS